MRTLLLALTALVGAAPVESGRHKASTGCVRNPRLVGPCFQVHGRLYASNGNPGFRIWRIGTERILGVDWGDDDEDPRLPAELGQLNVDRDVIGDFTVCPLTRERAGWMQDVCVESVARWHTRKNF